MTEIDPWAMPETVSVNPGSVQLPGSIYTSTPRLRPLGRRTPTLAIGFAALYVLFSIVEIFSLDHAATLAGQLNDMITANQFPTLDQSAQLQSDNGTVSDVSWIALAALVATVLMIAAWHASLTDALGPIRAHRALFRHARYRYLQTACALSVLISIFLWATVGKDTVNSYTQVVDHDHLCMLYCGVRVLVGLLVVYFANRLRRMADEAVGLINGTFVPD